MAHPCTLLKKQLHGFNQPEIATKEA